MATIKLTVFEQEFLLDRLEGGVMGGVLYDTHDELTEEEAEAKADRATELVRSGTFDVPDDEFVLSALADAIEGHAWFARQGDAVNDGEVTPQQMAADKRRVRALVSKFNDAGIECEFPSLE